MTPEIRYHSGPDRDGAMWVTVGKSDRLRPVAFTTAQLVVLSRYAHDRVCDAVVRALADGGSGS